MVSGHGFTGCSHPLPSSGPTVLVEKGNRATSAGRSIHSREDHLRVGKLLENLNITPTNEHCYLLYALSTGLAVIDLATARKNGGRRAARTLEITIALMRT